MRYLLTGLTAAVLFPALASAGDLTVKIIQVRSDQGSVLAALYDSEASYMQLPSARAHFKVKASRGELTYVFHDLPAGRYALSAFHDENGNDKLDRNILGIPKEGYGFSNARSEGALPFSKAAFDFDGTTGSITVALRY